MCMPGALDVRKGFRIFLGLIRSSHFGDEPIALTGYGLNKLGAPLLVSQGTSDLAYRFHDGVLGYKRILPNHIKQLLLLNCLPMMFHENRKRLKRLGCEMDAFISLV